jgi:WD40 repeat protein
LWDVASKKLIRMWKDTPPVNRKVAFAPNGSQVLSYGNDAVQWWDVKADRPVRSLPLRKGLGDAPAGFSTDGRRFIYASAEELIVRVLELPGGREAIRLESPPSPHGHWAFSPDGRYAAGGTSDGCVYLWRLPDPPKGERVQKGGLQDDKKKWTVAPLPDKVGPVQEIPIRFQGNSASGQGQALTHGPISPWQA